MHMEKRRRGAGIDGISMNERTFHSSQAHRLDDPERRQWLPPDEVTAQIPLKEGDAIADIGAGTGYFTLHSARIVGESGRVFAVDFQRGMLERIKLKLAVPGSPSNVELIDGEAANTSLPAQSCDVVFMANIWHELDNHTAVLTEAVRILRPGGKLVIVDWRSDLPAPPGPPPEYRVSSDQVQTTLQDRGWQVMETTTVGMYSHLILAGFGSSHR